MKKRNLLMSMIVIFGFTSITMAQVPNYVPTNGLVGWFPFNGNANDGSGLSNNGIATNVTFVNDRFGNPNSSVNFPNNNTTSNIDLGTAINPSVFTISAWCFRTNNSNGFNVIISKYFLSQGFELQYLGFVVPNGSVPNSIASFTPYALNTWEHLIAVYDGNYAKMYRNNILISSCLLNPGGTIGDSLPQPSYSTGSHNLTIGDRALGTGYEFNFEGNLDDIGIWNRALTQQEISELYNVTNCSNNLTISPASNQLQSGSAANFIATTSDQNPSYVWQSDLGQGFQTLNNYGNYTGVNSNSLSISNVQLSEHNQPIRVISTSGECIDTSNVATINITDTCILTINDTITTLISVTDTLIINALITGLTPPNILNTIKVFPNPTNDHITIDFGNFASMNGYTLKITNSIGQIVFTTPINQQSSYVDLSTWSGNGIYFIQIIDTQNNTIENRKIVLQ